MFQKNKNVIVIILTRVLRILIIEGWIFLFFFLFARFKSQPALISRALRRDKFTWRTCYHSWHPHAFILGDERERVASERGRRVRGRMSMKGGDFSISYSSRRRKCKRTPRYCWGKEEKRASSLLLALQNRAQVKLDWRKNATHTNQAA